MSDNLIILDANSVMRYLKTTEVDPDTFLHVPHQIIHALPIQHIDSFSRLRVADPGYRFDSQLTYKVDADLWDTSVVNGSVAHDATERWAVMTADSGGAGNKAVLQSHYHAPYTPGRGQLSFITFLFGSAPGAGGLRRVGYWDGSDGVYLEQTPTAVRLVLDSSTTSGAQTVEKADWNLDPLDGSGPSKMTLDLTKVQILVVQMQALYVGRVVVGFDIDGDVIPVHQFVHANSIALPYIAQASLPVRYEVVADSTAGDVVMYAICSSVISEGGQDLQDMPGRQFTSYGENTDVDSAAEAVLVVRPKAQLNSINQNAVVVPVELDIAVAAAGVWIEVRRNATVSAGDFTDVDATYSVCEESFCGNVGTDPTVTADTGQLIDKFYVPAAATVRGAKAQGLGGKVLLAYSHLLSSADNIAIMARGGTNSEVRASLKWKEIR